jgi:hypothetical protein
MGDYSVTEEEWVQEALSKMPAMSETKKSRLALIFRDHPLPLPAVQPIGAEMSLETWKMSDPDNEARLLGYWIVHIGHGFLLHRFDEPRVYGEWFSTEKDLRARLAEVADLPRWRLPLRDNPMVEHFPYGVLVTDEAGRWFDAPAHKGDAYIYTSGRRPTIGNWEECS